MEARRVLLLNGVLRLTVLLLQLYRLRLCQTLLLIEMIMVLRQTLLLLVDQHLLVLLRLRLVLLLLRLLILLLFLLCLALLRRCVRGHAQPEQRHRADASCQRYPIQDIDSHGSPHFKDRSLADRRLCSCEHRRPNVNGAECRGCGVGLPLFARRRPPAATAPRRTRRQATGGF